MLFRSVEIPASVNYGGNTYSVTAIKEQAFRDCPGLMSVTIPNTITAIGYEAFYSCTSLVEVKVNWDTPLLVPANTFMNVNTANVSLKIPGDAYSQYSNAAVWKDFDISESMSSITTHAANPITVYATPEGIVITGAPLGQTIQVYNISGVLVAAVQTQNIASLQTTIPLPQTGVYVVKIGCANFKVVKN